MYKTATSCITLPLSMMIAEPVNTMCFILHASIMFPQYSHSSGRQGKTLRFWIFWIMCSQFKLGYEYFFLHYEFVWKTKNLEFAHSTSLYEFHIVKCLFSALKIDYLRTMRMPTEILFTTVLCNWFTSIANIQNFSFTYITQPLSTCSFFSSSCARKQSTTELLDSWRAWLHTTWL